jgi:tRNA G18 (ribose-2'-O)-methylase SpoU
MGEATRNGRAGRGGGTGAARGAAAAASEVLTSRENRWLKEFRVALRGGVAAANGAVGVEGVRLVEEALTSGCRVEAVLFSESGERFRERLAPLVGKAEMGFPVLRTTDRLFEGIADTEHPQGVAALVVPRVFTLEELLGGRRKLSVDSSQLLVSEKKTQDPPSQNEDGAATGPVHSSQSTVNSFGKAEPKSRREAGPTWVNACAALIVVLAGVQDPGNVGTILRTAAAFGATGVVTAATGQSGTASPFAPKAMRASAGAALHLPILTGMALGILLTQLKLNGIRTVASCAHEDEVGTMAPWEVEWCEPIALLVGNEGAGLPEDVVHAADGRIHIPMATLPLSGQARVESLNAAAAATVVLYEAYRQRARRGSNQ